VELVLLASLVGAALGCAGAVFQAILRNPLADPYLLGAASGASLASFLWQAPWMTGVVMGLGSLGGALGQQAFAFVGAMLAVLLVFAVAMRGTRLDPTAVVLAGVIVNAVCGAVLLLLISIVKDPAAAGGPLAYLLGAINTSVPRVQIGVAAFLIGIGYLFLAGLGGQLTVALLSESEAQALGVQVDRLRWLGLGMASILTASAVALAGPIGFIGLVCPHLARLMVGNDQRRLLPVATACGAAVLVVADATARGMAGAQILQTVLPVGVLTALLGGPFFLLLLWNRRRGD
jgi:iron complex transport system permease protein